MRPSEPSTGKQEATSGIELTGDSSPPPPHRPDYLTTRVAPHLPARRWLRAASAGLMGGLVGLLLDALWPCQTHDRRS